MRRNDDEDSPFAIAFWFLVIGAAAIFWMWLNSGGGAQ